MRLQNISKLKDRRKELRKNQTDSEQLLWSRLRNKQINELKFFRQFSIGFYILDFYCPTIRLAIELDGSQHMENKQKEYDDERTKFLEANRIRVLRFWSNDVIRNLQGVMERVLEEVERMQAEGL
ncbi:endonuclease domain-containing protein [Patescibacteria group bacterium]|nr:endonuclease domain-containing protein [Patescibacteria group bacterium]